MILWLMLTSLSAADWHFTDVTTSAGIDFEHRYSATRETAYIAGGVACGDYNNDGWPDLYLVSGAQGRNALYRNNGDGTFSDVAEQAGVGLEGRFDCGPLFADFDGDGWLDLFVGGIDSSNPKLFRNSGDGTFQEVTQQAGLNISGNTFSATLGDLDRDGDLDLFTAHWGATDQKGYWRNNGDGTFSNATDLIGLGEAFQPNHNFTPNFADFNGDHWPDLVIAADFGSSRVFLNDGAGHLIDSTTPVISDENGMGAAVGDYDNDGDLDWFVTSISEARGKRGRSGNRLYANRGDGSFEDVTDRAGVRTGYWGWAATMADFDNDGLLDIFHVNGFRSTFGDGYHQDPSRFFHAIGGGIFSEKASDLGLGAASQGRGVACFDFDGDGDLDIFIANNGEPAKLYRNDGGNQNAYLRVRLKGNPPNSEAIGARLELLTDQGRQFRQIRAGNNFMSQDPTTAHFGLGSSASGQLKITWPDGTISRLQARANSSLIVAQPAAAPATHTLWIPHITRSGGGFETLLELRNFSGDDAILDLQAWNTEGRHLGNQSLELKASAGQRVDVAELFTGMAVSHLRLYGPVGITGSAIYRQKGVAASEAQSHNQYQDGTLFFIYPGNPLLTFDGVALVNSGEKEAAIVLSVLDRDGVEQQSVPLTQPLMPNAKTLILLDDYFLDLSEKLIKISTTEPVLALFLRGTRPGIEPGLLFSVAPLPHPTLNTPERKAPEKGGD